MISDSFIGYWSTGLRVVSIDMTLTAPACPVAQTFPGLVEEQVSSLEGVKQVHVELVWDPPWTRDLMSEAARLELGFFDPHWILSRRLQAH